jgi:hypothetical protein
MISAVSASEESGPGSDDADSVLGKAGDFFANQTDARFAFDALRDQFRKLVAIDGQRGACRERASPLRLP